MPLSAPKLKRIAIKKKAIRETKKQEKEVRQNAKHKALEQLNDPVAEALDYEEKDLDEARYSEDDQDEN